MSVRNTVVNPMATGTQAPDAEALHWAQEVTFEVTPGATSWWRQHQDWPNLTTSNHFLLARGWSGVEDEGKLSKQCWQQYCHPPRTVAYYKQARESSGLVLRRIDQKK